MHRRMAELPFIKNEEIKEIETANRYIERLHKRSEKLVVLADMLEFNSTIHTYYADVEQARQNGTLLEFLVIVKIFANLFADLYVDHQGDESLLSEALTVYSKMRADMTWFYKTFRSASVSPREATSPSPPLATKA